MIRFRNSHILILILALIALTVSVNAEVPQLINYQGRLTDTGDNPVDSVVAILFTIYGPRGGVLWQEGHDGITVTDGLFNVLLGSYESLPDNLFSEDTAIWLGITVGENPELEPRTRITTVPYAYHALRADTAEYVSGGSSANGWVDDGSVVSLATSSDRVGIGTSTANEKLVVGHDIGNYGGKYIVSGSPYLDDVCGFKMGFSADNHTTLQWDGDDAPFKIHTRQGGIDYFNTLVVGLGSVGIGTTPPDSVALSIYRTPGMSSGGYDVGIDCNVSAYGGASGCKSIVEGNYAYSGVFQATGYSHAYGVYGNAIGDVGATIVHGVHGTAQGIAGDVYAGYFEDNVHISGHLSKFSGSFKIDHPLDPANKYLIHSFVESPDMMNVYNGNIVTDANGDAEVVLPDYFETLNKDFRYQLTVIGTFAQAIVSEEINQGRFGIKTDKPNVKVSWQVTGVRQDPWANEHRIQAEVDKKEDEKGYYMVPKLYGFGEERGIDYRYHRDVEENKKDLE